MATSRRLDTDDRHGWNHRGGKSEEECTVKAVMLSELGGPEQLMLVEVPDPEPGPTDVVVRVLYAGVNRRDVYARQGLYPGVKLPAIPGSDAAGEVVAVGREVEGRFKTGQPVIINPSLNWGDEPRFYGPDFSILGIPVNGTYAQYVKVPADNVHPKPEYLTWAEAACLGLGGVTAYRALFTRGQLAPDEVVIVPGIGGGVATLLLVMAVQRGAHVFVTSSQPEKLQRAVELGASGGVNYNDAGWPRQLRELSGGADLSVDSIGGQVFNDLVGLAKPGSRIVVFGATRGPVPQVVMPRIFFKQLDILGTTMGSPWDFTDMLDYCRQHRVRPVVDREFSLEQAAEAHRVMEDGTQFGKLVLKVS